MGTRCSSVVARVICLQRLFLEPSGFVYCNNLAVKSARQKRNSVPSLKSVDYGCQILLSHAFFLSTLTSTITVPTTLFYSFPYLLATCSCIWVWCWQRWWSSLASSPTTKKPKAEGSWIPSSKCCHRLGLLLMSTSENCTTVWSGRMVCANECHKLLLPCSPPPNSPTHLQR